MRRLLAIGALAASLATLPATATTASAQMEMPFGITPSVGRVVPVPASPSYGAPTTFYSAPTTTYAAPATTYSAPTATLYAAPATTTFYSSGYRSPVYGYGYTGYGSGYRSPVYGYTYAGYGSGYRSPVYGYGYTGYGP